jgi:2-oxoglutarate dehydrogenase E2 component (dihydrolipoamide succinyltransferase)
VFLHDRPSPDLELTRSFENQIDVAVNAPESGIIKEFLVNEEDTVTVGQDLLRIELGGAPSGEKPAEAKETPKEPAAETQPEQKKAPEPTPQETKPAPPAPAKEEAPAPKQPSKPAKAAAPEAPATLGSREERRVRRTSKARASHMSH